MLETRHNLNDETVERIQDLIKLNLDSYEGYKSASEDVHNARLKQLFSELAMSRSRQAASLQTYVSWSGESPEEEGTLKGRIHRTWLNMRSALNGGDEEVVLTEASRGEEHIKERYEEVLKEAPGSALSEVLHEQYNAVLQDYKRIESLKQTYG